MGSFQDAMKKAGLSSEQEPAAESPEKPSEESETKPDASAEGQERREESRPGGDRKPRGPKPPPEKLEEKPCAKCGTAFMPKHAKHRLCPKCAEEQFAASKEKAGKPGEAGAGTPATVGDRPPRPERRDGPKRAEGQRTEGPRSEGPRSDRQRPERDRAERPPRPLRPAESRESQKEAPQGFPRDYLQSGYFSGGVLRDEVFDAWARHVAGLLVSRGLSTVQMRAFHGHIRRAEASEKAGRDFREVREEILKIRPVAAARQGRKLIPGEFADFLDRNLDQVKDPRSLRAFAEHFQAVVGYTAGRLKK